MGRPLDKRVFGNTNTGGIGGEGLADMTITGAGTGYTDGDVITISAPDLPGGVQAVATVLETGGLVDGITITNAGSGYLTAPTLDMSAIGNNDATGTAVLTDANVNAIGVTAYVSSANNAADIVKQTGSKAFKVTTSEGTAECRLVTATPAAIGEMRITATDSASGTYFVTKISGKTCTLTQGTGSQFPTGAKVAWNLDTAVVNASVVLN
jgi:hypothetical protein